MRDDLIDETFVSENFPIATKIRRFLNFIIDLIVLTILLSIVSILLFHFNQPEDLEELLSQNNGSIASDYFLVFGVFFIYYFGMEFFFKGKTIGKYVTRTRAVNMDNSRLQVKEAVFRTLSRLVPFETISFLTADPSGWHDSWTQTIVIEDKGWDK